MPGKASRGRASPFFCVPPSFPKVVGLGGFASNARRQYPSNRNRFGNEFQPLRDLNSEQIQQLVDALQNKEQEAPSTTTPRKKGDPITKLLKERQATIFVTVVRRNNQVIVRTGDIAMDWDDARLPNILLADILADLDRS